MAKAEFVLKDGTVLTPELEKQLADEAEAGYDLTQALRIDLRPGRPSRGEPAGESQSLRSLARTDRSLCSWRQRYLF